MEPPHAAPGAASPARADPGVAHEARRHALRRAGPPRTASASAAAVDRGPAQKNSPFEPTEGPGFVSGEKPRYVAPGLNSGYFATSSELTEPAWGMTPSE